MTGRTGWLKLAALGAIAAAGFGVTSEAPASSARTETRTSPSGAPRIALTNLFVENRGQADERVAFTLPGRDRDFWFTGDGVRVAMTGAGKRWSVAQEFVGARGSKPDGARPGPTTFSWFRGPREKWVCGAPSHTEIAYRAAWPGVDVVYSAESDTLKHAFHVAARADASRIALRYRGAEPKLLSDGTLRVATPAGVWDDARPVAWQDSAAGRVIVDAAYELRSCGTVGFRLGAYDASLPLVIDPASVVYAGYISGLDGSGCADVAVDAQGNAYVTGNTMSSAARGFPVTVGPDLTYNANGGGFATDVFVAKLAPDGASLLYCGYIGGDSQEVAKSIAVDSNGRAYVAGWTKSTESSFPVLGGPTLLHRGGDDAFVARVAAGGASLEYCGYVGGDESDTAVDVAVDSLGRAIVVGATSSLPASFPAIAGPETTLTSGAAGFVARVSADGTNFDYCGYVGGAFISGTDVRGVAVGPLDRVYLCGTSGDADAGTSGGLPVKNGPDLTVNGGTDVFVAKLKADGTGYDYFGMIGGSELDAAAGIAVGPDGAAYVAGNTASDETTLPVQTGPDLTLNGLNNPAIGGEGFIAKVKPNGAALDYCGYIGGADHDEPTDVVVDASGSAYVALVSYDLTTFPQAGGPELRADPELTAANVVARVRADGAGLVWTGYVGTTGWAEIFGLALDGDGALYLGGQTASSNFTTVAGPGVRKKTNSQEGTIAKVTVTGYADDSEPGGGGGGEGEAIESFFLPRKVTAKTNAKTPAKSTLTLSGFFDTGPADAALNSAATLDAGGFHFAIPGLAAAGKGFAFQAPGVVFSVTPNRTGSSRATFKLKTTGDLGGKIDPAGDLTLAFANSAVDAEGTVGLASGAYALGKRRGALKSPNLYLAKAKASLKGAGNDAFTIVAGLATNGVTPAAASDVTIDFGTYSATVLASQFTGNGDVYEFKGAAPGVTLVRLDYLRETATVGAKGITLGALGASPVVVRIGLAVGSDERAVRVRMGVKGKSLRY